MSVINAQATAYIDVFHQNATGFQLILQFVDTVAKGNKVTHIQNLRTDVKVKSDEFDMLHFYCHIYHFIHILHTDSKFVLGQASRNIGMSMRTDIGIDTESHIGYLILSSSKFVYHFQFRNRFYIETEDSVFQSEVNLPIGFAYSRKDNFACRKSGTDSSTDFSTTHTICSHTAFTDNGKHFRIGVCFYCIVYGIVRIFGNLLVDSRQCITQHFRIVIIERCLQSTELIDWKYSFHNSKNLFS